MQQATCLPDFLNAEEFATLYNRAVDARGDDVYEKYDLNAIKSNPNLYGNENLLDYLDKFGFSTLHSLSVSGGNKFVKYYVSGGYTHMKGLYSGVGRDRFNYSAKLDAYIVKGLTLSLDITGNRSNNKNTSYTTIDAAYSYSPLQVLRFTTGELASLSGSNPLLAVEGLGGYIRNKTNFNTISATLNYELPFLKGMSIYLKATVDNNNSINTTFSSPETLYLYDNTTGEISEDPLTTYPTAKISLSQRDQFVDNKLFEGGINYTNTFNEKHDFSAMLVVNYQDYRNRYMTGTNNDMAGKYPEVIGTATDSKLVGNEYFYQRASLIGRFTYGYDNRYFIETSFRVDGSTKLPPDNRWGFFPTVSGAWVLSNESFFRSWDQPVISNLKFRASTGILGRDAVLTDYGYLMNYIYTTNSGYQIGGNFKPGIIPDPSSFPNPDLRWEKSHDYNIAVDAGLWKNRFAVTYEYYWRFKTDMLTYAPTYLYPPSAGTDGNVPYINFGKVKAWGWDLTITHKNSIGQFKYDIGITLSKTFDKVLDYGDESSVVAHQRRKGRSSQLWLLYESDGLFQSWEEIANYPIDQDGQGNATLAPGDIKYKDQDGDHVITANDRIYVKSSAYPDFSMSLSLGFSYKGLFMNAMLQGVAGYKQQINELYTLESGSLQRFQRYHLTDTWTEDNPDAAYPRIKFASKNDNNRRESDFWIRNCNYLRLRSLTIGYALPAKLLQKKKINSVSIALQGSNLFTISSLENGIDPESLRGYPIQRSYGLTLNFGF
ncbi:susC/RagA family TonB-linked outer membrane protein [Bacteroides sp. CAG:144]|nr:susC/RagA family TonB-linked outer membrane protein [Bacteroides sp. CAG:144]